MVEGVIPTIKALMVTVLYGVMYCNENDERR